MGIWLLRGTFLLVTAGVAVSVVTSKSFEGAFGINLWIFFVMVMMGAVGIIGVDIFVRQKRLDVITSVYFGILIGLFLTYTVGVVLQPLMLQSDLSAPNPRFHIIQLLLGVALCYICISLLMQTRNDFRFVIPYVEFSKEVKGLKPFVLDTSVIIDGRIADLAETNVLDNQIVMPRFILNELQAIADSGDKLRRARGRRGLDILNKLRSSETVDFKIHDHEPAELTGQPVDMKLVLLAKSLGGKIVTGDYALNKVARIHNVPVINLNDIANSLKPVFLPGESFEVRVVKPGEAPGQGVGYLDDGTMVVVEGGREYINRSVKIAVTSVLQTSAGRMIFGKPL
ncbi:MAG: TRAM domain-containing protein [Pirellulales bacterium]